MCRKFQRKRKERVKAMGTYPPQIMQVFTSHVDAYVGGLDVGGLRGIFMTSLFFRLMKIRSLSPKATLFPVKSLTYEGLVTVLK
jgi:hypothetical protein